MSRSLTNENFHTSWSSLLVENKRGSGASIDKESGGRAQIALALSGGVDSVVLLELLSQWFIQNPGQREVFDFFAIHVNHGIHSLADEHADFCKVLASRYQLPIHIVTLSPFLESDIKKLGLEAVAREKRYSAFKEYLSTKGSGFVVTAHHQTDQIETVLLNILRGSGVKGARGMSSRADMPVNEQAQDVDILLCRPLLGFSRQSIERYASDKELEWIEDPTNVDQNYRRNYLRHSVLPVLQPQWPDYQNSISRFSNHIKEADEILYELASEWLDLNTNDHGKSIQSTRLLSLSIPRQKWLLRAWLSGFGLSSPNADKLEEFIRQINSSDSGNAELSYMDSHSYKRTVIVLQSSKLWLRPEQPDSIELVKQAISLRADAPAQMVDSIKLPVGQLAVDHAVVAEIVSAEIELTVQLLCQCLPMSGAIQPIARKHAQKIKNICQEKNIPKWQRANLPMVCSADAVLWIANIGWLTTGNQVFDLFVAQCVAAEKKAEKSIFSWLW